MADSFKDQWGEYGAWRREFSFLLRLFSQWLKDSGLWEVTVEDRIKRLEHWVVSDTVMVAFVADCARGKSELINALFFADYDRRILPIRAGRSTMCPTEFGFDPAVSECLRLLPMETRLQPQDLAHWRATPEAWTQISLDVQDAAQLASSLACVTETIAVTPAQAQALGFDHAQTLHKNPPLHTQDLVEVPRWRHALVNIPHPLLQQGLVILDTPGLNALGAEPALTVGLLQQAHALVFVLGADTGVTPADLTIWRKHLRDVSDRPTASLVVLNKTDTLWDALSTPVQVQTHIDSQRMRAAQSLGLAREQVLAVSAQKGLLAKITGNAELLEKSGLMVLEAALAHGILGGRQVLLGGAVHDGLVGLQTTLLHTLALRRRDLDVQRKELEGLCGRSQAVLRELNEGITLKKQQFSLASAKTRAINAVHRRLFRKMQEEFESCQLAPEMHMLAQALGRRGVKWGFRKLYTETFEHLRLHLQHVERIADELVALQASSFLQLNAEFGFSLQPVAPLALDAYRMDLALTERSHLSCLGLRHLLRLQQVEFTSRLVDALYGRLQTLQAALHQDAQDWVQSALAPLNAQLQQQRTHLQSRLETAEKIDRACAGSARRLQEIECRAQALEALEKKLTQQIAHLLETNEDSVRAQAEVLSSGF